MRFSNYKFAFEGAVTAITRFSLGLVIVSFPVVFSRLYGSDSATVTALALNLAGYSSWLALGAHASVMRDFRSTASVGEKVRLSRLYSLLAAAQSLGAIVLTVLIASTYVALTQPTYLVGLRDLFLVGLVFGISVQATSFWLNVALGTSYSTNHFVGVGLAVSTQRVLSIVLAVAGATVGVELAQLLAGLAAYFVFSSAAVYYFYRTGSPQKPSMTEAKQTRLAQLVMDAAPFIKWSLLATAVFLFPVTAISAVAPQQLIPATAAFFLAGAIQNLIAAVITPRANTLQDGIGDLEILKSYFIFVTKIAFFVTVAMLVVLLASQPLCSKFFGGTMCSEFSYAAVILTIASGVRSITLAPTQAAIALKNERRFMLSPSLEALTSIAGVSLCWLLGAAHLIVWVFAVSALVRVGAAFIFEKRIIKSLWVRNKSEGL